jgi:hypothetical protein
MARKTKIEEKIDTRTPEEKLMQTLEYQFIPEPTRFLNIGDEVNVGGLKEAVVKEIYCGGKYYLIEYTTEKKISYSEKAILRVKDTFEWLKVFPREPKAPSIISKERIRGIQSYRTTLNGLVLNYYHFGIDMDPDYQRGYVWDLEDKRKLIDSIFKEMKIGLFVLNKLPFREKGPMSEIIDGKQRLTAIIEFIEDRFDFQGYKWSELYHVDRDRFMNLPIELAEFEESSKENILKTFLNVNQAGKPVSEEHLSKVKQMLEEIEEKQ